MIRAIWNHGGNWFLFMVVCFGSIELGSMALTRCTGKPWFTLSRTFWHGLSHSWWLEAVLTLGLVIGCFILIAHLLGSLWK